MKVVVAEGTSQAAYVIDSFREHGHELVVINSSHETAQDLATTHHVPVYVGRPWRRFALEEAGVKGADLFIALSPSDMDNFASCLMAKNLFSVKKVICLVDNPAKVDLFKKLGIDSVICSTYLLANSILSEATLRKMIKSLAMEDESFAMVESTVSVEDRIANMKIMDMNFPSYASIAAIVRNHQMIVPNGSVILYPEDKLYVVAASENEEKLMAFLKEEKDHGEATR